MVDGVELAELNEIERVMYLDAHPTVIGNEPPQGSREPPQVGDVRVHIVGRDQAGRTVLRADAGRGALVEEGGQCRNALIARRLPDIHRGLNAQAANSLGNGVLKQVAVVAGHLDHEVIRGVRRKPQACNGVGDVCAGVINPAVGVRREVCVLGEIVLGANQRRDLQQHTVAAKPQVQRISGFRQIQLIGVQKLLAGWGGTQIDDAEQLRRVAEATAHRFLLCQLCGVRMSPDPAIGYPVLGATATSGSRSG